MAGDRERILDPSYLGDLPSRSIDDVRAMRHECQAVETGLSYLRRMVQGRLDIVGLELERRATGGEPVELADLISRLPETLADRTRTPGFGRLPQLMEPGDVDDDLEDELDAIVHPSDLAGLNELDDTALRALADRLADDRERRRRHRAGEAAAGVEQAGEQERHRVSPGARPG